MEFGAAVHLVLSVILYLSSSAHSQAASPVLLFQHDTTFDNVKVISESDSLDLLASTLIWCASLCGQHAWCTSFFFAESNGDCSLHAAVFLDINSTIASMGNRYYKNFEDWCLPEDGRVYDRLSQLCLHLETREDKRLAYGDAVSACANMGMRLISNLTPVKMEALVAISQNNPAFGNWRIGLKRRGTSRVFEWLDGQPLAADMNRYWKVNQPNGHTNGQNCVSFQRSAGSLWNDNLCYMLKNYACELLKP